jgi:DNA-binding winged helix-turn-helix (wHTH) protein/tetratricopeptide (TPR) repeat protein
MIYTFTECELDTGRHELRRLGSPCHLEPQVFDVLTYLVRNRDRLVTREDLLREVWGHSFVTPANLDSRIKAARQAIGDTGQAQALIRTVRGRGFRFAGQVEERLPARSTSVPGGVLTGDVPADREAVTDSARALRGPGQGGPVQGTRSMIGRGPELARLHGYLADASAGTRRLVFVTGEAGIGKSTLVSAFLEAAGSAPGLRVGCGQCLEHHGPGEPYMPVLEATGRLCRQPGAEAVVGALAKWAPAWLAQLSWLAEPQRGRVPAAASIGATRERMLREMNEVLEALTAEHPLVLVLEDLHWSDPSTLVLLDALARRPERARLLVIGTYRPAQASASNPPLRSLAHELRVRGLCTELALGLLDEPAVAAFLAMRLFGDSVPGTLARLLRKRTDGNPLFLSTVLDGWIGEGRIVRDENGWGLRGDPEDLVVAIPADLRELVEQRVRQLDPAHQHLLEAASAAGAGFAAASVGAALQQDAESVESVLAGLAREGQFIRDDGVDEWPDGTVTARFAFVHDLYREVVYDRVPAGTKLALHRRIAARIETGYGDTARAQAAELAMHFLKGREMARAVRYLHLAGEDALHRSAHREAITHLTLALELLREQPDLPERTALEITVNGALAFALVATRGWADTDAERALLRARELTRQLDDPSLLSGVLYALATLHEYRGEYRHSQTLIEERLDLAEVATHALQALESHELLSCSLFHQGQFGASLHQADRGIGYFSAGRPNAILAFHGEDPGVACHYWSALDLWFLGFPDRAHTRMRLALQLATDPSRLYSLATAEMQAARLHQHRREPELARAHAEAAISLAARHGLPYQHAVGMVVAGWARCAAAGVDSGLAEIVAGLEAHRQTGAAMERPYLLSLLADAYRVCGRPREGLAVLDEALALLAGGRGFFYQAEMLRLKAELMLQAGHAPEGAEAQLQDASRVAREQNARSTELRIALNLARLWVARGEIEQAKRLVGAARRGVEEGQGTPDSREAEEFVRQPGLPG